MVWTKRKLLFTLSVLVIFLFSFYVFSSVRAEIFQPSIEIRLAECSDGIDNDGDFLIDYPDDPQCDSALDDDENMTGTETHATTTVLTNGGGFSHTNNDGLDTDFSFPADFYTSSVRLFVNTYANNFFGSSKPAPSGKSFVGKTYDFDLYNAVSGAKVETLDEEVTITLRYNDGDVSGLDESTLSSYSWGASDSAWQEITVDSRDTSANTVTFSTASFSSFALFGSAPSAPPPSTPSGGGGGGGGGGSSFSLAGSVKLTGRAFPKSAVNIVVDGSLKDTVVADERAMFSVDLISTAGSHSFGVYSTDSKGRRSLTYTFSFNVGVGTISTVSGIFLAPTIDIDKTEVRRGDPISIFGQTIPKSEVIIAINSKHEIVEQVTTDEEGVYLLDFNTSVLDYGRHTAKSQTVTGENKEEVSALSSVVSFEVGTKNIKKTLAGDMNGDGKINVVDFSIMLFWWGSSAPAAKTYDVNGDGRVDIKDMSIMFFYWTG
jgi:hypothetical protein